MNKIAIIGAMPCELADIRAKLGDAEVKRISGYDFYINEYNGKRIVNVCCGIAKVNAALCTQVLIDNFKPDCIINAGVAGGMNDAVGFCDIVISTEVLPHDLELRLLKEYPPYCAIFKADEKLISAAEKACSDHDMKSFRGRIVSGESFISSVEVKSEIQAKHSPYAVDMESSAVGHCCYINEMPFVCVRCISDNADTASSDEFEKIAAKKVADIVLEMITLL